MPVRVGRPELAAAYARCRELHRRHGRSYFLATRLLPAAKRPHVHALYGFARYTDEIVDDTDAAPLAVRAERLRDWSRRVHQGLAGEPPRDPLLPAVLDTVDAFGIDHADISAFLRSMEMDLTVEEYPTRHALREYVAGSAAAIGTMMLPILGATDLAAAREPARELGIAFQLTNFVRDVAEDLRRGRLYLPVEDLARFGLTRADLVAAADQRLAPPAVRRLIRYEVTRAREHYALAAPGIGLLAPSARACVRAAYHLYGGILDEITRSGFDVFARRAVVPRWRRATIVARSLARR